MGKFLSNAGSTEGRRLLTCILLVSADKALPTQPKHPDLFDPVLSCSFLKEFLIS